MDLTAHDVEMLTISYEDPVSEYGKLKSFPVTLGCYGKDPITVYDMQLTSYNWLFYFTDGVPQMPFVIKPSERKQVNISFVPYDVNVIYDCRLTANSTATHGTNNIVIQGKASGGPYISSLPITAATTTPIGTWVGCNESKPYFNYCNYNATSNLMKFRIKTIDYNKGDIVFEWGMCNSNWLPTNVSATNKNIIVRILEDGYYPCATGYFNSQSERTITMHYIPSFTTDFYCVAIVASNGNSSYYYCGHVTIVP
jgi:hypothetical protein